MPSHLILVGACYLDTLLRYEAPCKLATPVASSQPQFVPFFPSEDSKLRATSSTTRVGGNCPNSIQVLRQLFSSLPASPNDVILHLISCLPARSSPASHRIASTLATDLTKHGRLNSNNTEPKETSCGRTSLEHCIYREDHTEPASSYILRSTSTGTRTIINYNSLPEMSVAEFKERVLKFDPHDQTWWHFEVIELPRRYYKTWTSVMSRCISHIGRLLTRTSACRVAYRQQH
ncbi:hypothetical protein LIA77_01125 [Sarocladium implicatum]|nr:hypothetical protein LIA77_01125 [Sarocladium implicatum]